MKFTSLLSTGLLATLLPVVIANPMPLQESAGVQQSPNKRYAAVPRGDLASILGYNWEAMQEDR
ncbi:hypothetical protein MGYG_06516 [Nannizzia gypsea CBS 118893]|uniref:Uncharacterized protein n=1 Tax=Arthroderma gypseum (strain ATCC MYA-4604 / CBS 118893) TaxID=535722 RepID=E4UZI8_ARTGP|nr:hypothetical protein MGYG_06516 [Nannizzia gypsea CBS 118893]EFR03518.1 hypothetical protein MGYG_06516 [Nannizzia gypsea CBS 118893]